ncbi:MAG: hypothetical protein WBU92_06320, partial [Candidatus Dormiibacterota bacterium]
VTLSWHSRGRSRRRPFRGGESGEREAAQPLERCSFGAFHAADPRLRRADLFPMTRGMSGACDVSVGGVTWEHGDTACFNNPMACMANAEGDHLEWRRRRARRPLVCGQGTGEDANGALQSTRDFAALPAGKGVPQELGLWGRYSPRAWPSWPGTCPGSAEGPVD